jgi:cephalosporin-C deacetylase
MLTDLPLAELRNYRPDDTEPADFGQFWADQLGEARQQKDLPSFTPASSPIRHADVYDVTFGGHGGSPIKGWLLDPHAAGDGAAIVVEFIGYGGGRGNPLDWLRWSSAGHPHLVMDTRGQGSGWLGGHTADPGDAGAPSSPGFMTRGIDSPACHYYTRLFIDAVRAVDTARAWPGAAGRPVVTAGHSQGGGLAIAAAHLAGDVAATLPEVPFLADFRRAVDVTDANPYHELADYCRVHKDKVDQVFATLAYIDVVNHARRATAPALFAVGLTDLVTPPSTVFGAFNQYAGAKDIAVYPFCGHEGGGTQHFLAQLAFLAEAGLR